MEQHPIPQDVTGFQFKLIGAMTVKQFGYVAVGAILAVVSWYAPAQGFLWNFVAKGICVPFFGITGVVIAFVPIEGRPIDIMAVNFFHALISPNQYIYIKQGRKLSFTQITIAKIPPPSQTTQKTTSEPVYDSKKEQQLRALLSRSYQDSRNSLDQKELSFIKSISSMPEPVASPIAAKTTSTITSKPQSQIQSSSPVPTAQIKTTITKPIPADALITSAPKILDPEEAFKKKMQGLQKQSENISTQMSPAKTATPPTFVSIQTTPDNPPSKNVPIAHNIPQDMTKNAGFSHVSDTPNVVVGIVKDSRSNMLPNILVEIKDKEGNPVRAFKTNPLGQFASATPLGNGSYTIELEDPKKQHAFDVVQINASGEIMLPIEIISHDAREELRKALFN